MLFKATSLDGAWLIVPEPHMDERGTFVRTFCEHTFAERRLVSRFVQHSLATSRKRGTLRGLHFQCAPHGEVKLVRCVAGAIHDVIVDLRPGSATYRRWEAFELSAENGHLVYVPEGFAHGCQTLVDETTVSYLISAPHAPEAASGVRPDDPALGIRWPLPVSVIADRDRQWPLLP